MTSSAQSMASNLSDQTAWLHRAIRALLFFALGYCIIYAEINSALQKAAVKYRQLAAIEIPGRGPLARWARPCGRKEVHFSRMCLNLRLSSCPLSSGLPRNSIERSAFAFRVIIVG